MSSEKEIVLTLTSKEYRQLVFLGYLGAFVYQTKRTMEDNDLQSAYAMLHKLGMQGNMQGEKVMGADERLMRTIDKAVMKEVIAHNSDVMERPELWKELEKMAR